MSQQIHLVLAAGVLVFIGCVILPTLLGSPIPVAHRIAIGGVLGAIAAVLGIKALVRETKLYREKRTAMLSDFNRLSRDYSKLKTTIEQSRGRIVSTAALLEAFGNIGSQSARSADVDKIVSLMMSLIERHLGVRKASLWFLDSKTGRCDLEASIGWSATEAAGYNARIGRGVLGHVLAKGRALFDEVPADAQKIAELSSGDGLTPLSCVPLLYADKVLGALCVEKVEPRAHIQAWESARLLTFLTSYLALVVANKALLDRSRDLATIDDLTRSATHSRFQEVLDSELRRADRYGDFLSVIVCDIDAFKAFNAEYGHEAGDMALKELASVFKKQCRDMDLVARFGGEEFAFVLPQTNKSGALILAGRLKEAASKLRLPGFDSASLTISLGLATFPDDATDKGALVQAACDSLAKAKEMGPGSLWPAREDA